MVKRVDYSNSISSACHIASLIYDQFTSDNLSNLSATSNSYIKRILIKLAKLIVALVVLNSEWSVSDSRDNARYQAGEVSIALKSFAIMQSTQLSPDCTKVSSRVFNTLLIQYITSELRDGAIFLSNQNFQFIYALGELSDLSEKEIFAKIAFFIQSLGIFISYSEIVQKLFDKNNNQQSDLLNQKIINCIRFIKGGETASPQNMLLIPNSVSKLISLTQDIVDAFDTLINGSLTNPLKFHENLLSMQTNPASLELKGLYLSCLESAKPAKSNGMPEIMPLRLRPRKESIGSTTHIIRKNTQDNVTEVRIVFV